MSATRTTLPVSDVHVEPGLNHRSEEEVAAGIEPLRESVARHGVLQPLLVRAREQGGVWLVAGHRRLAAAQAAELAEVPVAVVAGERLELTAVENLQRAQLTPLEEARAFKALADAGQSPKGIAAALSVSRKRVTERLAVLELTEAGQAAAGDGRLPLSAVSVLVELTRLSGALADRVLAAAEELGDAAALARDPGWLVGRALPFELEQAAAFGWLPAHRRVGLSLLGIEDAELARKAEVLAAASYEPAGVRLGEDELERAVAARCAWRDGRGSGVVSREWLAAQAPALIEAAWERHQAEESSRGGVGLGGGGGTAGAAAANGAGDSDVADREAEARAAARAQAAEDRRRAAAVNDELAAKLLTGLASAEWDTDTATFVAHTLLERGDDSPYGTLANTARLAAQGLRYLLPELRDETPPAKPGGQVKVSYPDAREAERRFWQWFERAQTPQEILGRTLVAYAAAAHAREEVVARSARHGDFRPNAAAARAFARICRKHLPPSLKRFAAELAERECGGETAARAA